MNNLASVQEIKDRASDLYIELEIQFTKKQVEVVHARAQAKTLEAIVDEVLKQI
jgi:hypothetical protein